MVKPTATYSLKLSRVNLLFSVVIAAVFTMTGCLESSGSNDIEGASWNDWWTAFVFGFATPAELLLATPILRYDPIVLVAPPKKTPSSPDAALEDIEPADCIGEASRGSLGFGQSALQCRTACE